MDTYSHLRTATLFLPPKGAVCALEQTLEWDGAKAKLHTVLAVGLVAGEVKGKKKLSPAVVFWPEPVIGILIGHMSYIHRARFCFELQWSNCSLTLYSWVTEIRLFPSVSFRFAPERNDAGI